MCLFIYVFAELTANCSITTYRSWWSDIQWNKDENLPANNRVDLSEITWFYQLEEGDLRFLLFKKLIFPIVPSVVGLNASNCIILTLLHNVYNKLIHSVRIVNNLFLLNDLTFRKFNSWGFGNYIKILANMINHNEQSACSNVRFTVNVALTNVGAQTVSTDVFSYKAFLASNQQRH